eukprot:CAMPEP_0194155048 /NCGR_PEP_ID=MMETSP0152-20130528/62990_1 /TAXON_ID=1049557 /ORGANISM="Thalassiothrix antarctica, Strain L6-D1" /LENGTH=341 /DNA_ID=CAMNT_0038861605 /DNA_START=72 /DNA_END=1097 /DNA_ORIENTATION=+
MTEGLLSITLAAAHLEAEQERSQQGSLATSKNPPKQSLGGWPMQSPPFSESNPISLDNPRQLSNTNIETSSDEDPITDPEETLIQILAQHPKETPLPPSANEIITIVQPDDVLCGRGGETNHHPGNVQYRGLVKKYQRLYLKAKRRDKPKIARLIVDTVRRRSGRFLKKDSTSGSWKDVGNNKAREKTSQALREGAPEIRENDSKRKASANVVLMHHHQCTGPHHISHQHSSMTNTTLFTNCAQVVSPHSSTSSLPTTEEVMIATTVSSSFPTYRILPRKKMKLSETVPEINNSVSNYSSTTNITTSNNNNTGSAGPRLKFLKSRLSNTSNTSSTRAHESV